MLCYLPWSTADEPKEAESDSEILTLRIYAFEQKVIDMVAAEIQKQCTAEYKLETIEVEKVIAPLSHAQVSKRILLLSYITLNR